MKIFLRSGYWLVAVSSWAVVGYALFSYLILEPGSTVHPQMKIVFSQHRIGILAHVVGASFGLLLGSLQFAERLRLARPRLHRLTGYLYLVLGVGVGGVAGLYMAQYAFGGLTSKVGFASLAVLSLICGSMGLFNAIKQRFAEHRLWMLRSFALIFAAVTLRLYLGLFFAAGYAFPEFYPLLAWISWIPNLLIVEWVIAIALRREAEKDESKIRLNNSITLPAKVAL